MNHQLLIAKLSLSSSSSWAELVLFSVSPVEGQHNIAYGLNNIADGLHNIADGLHIITDVLHNIADGLHNISDVLHNIADGPHKIPDALSTLHVMAQKDFRGERHVKGSVLF